MHLLSSLAATLHDQLKLCPYYFYCFLEPKINFPFYIIINHPPVVVEAKKQGLDKKFKFSQMSQNELESCKGEILWRSSPFAKVLSSDCRYNIREYFNLLLGHGSLRQFRIVQARIIQNSTEQSRIGKDRQGQSKGRLQKKTAYFMTSGKIAF